MAKDHRDGKAKVRVFYAEVEGGDETIQNGLQSLALALARAMQPPAPPRPKPLPVPLAPAREEERNLFNQTLEDEVVEEVEVEAEREEELTPPVSRPKTQRTPKQRSYAIVSSLNLRPEGQVSLVEFHREKSPSDQQEYLATFVHYLARELKLTGITEDHVYTCYKEVNKPVPADIMKVARNTATRKGWIDVADPKNWTLSVRGENFVEHELPKSKEAAK